MRGKIFCSPPNGRLERAVLRRSGTAAPAGAITGLLGFGRRLEKRDAFTSWPPARATRAAKDARARDTVDKRSIRLPIASHDRSPARCVNGQRSAGRGRAARAHWGDM